MIVKDIKDAANAFSASSTRVLSIAQSLVDIASATQDERLVALAEECLSISEVANDAWHNLMRGLISAARESRRETLP